MVSNDRYFATDNSAWSNLISRLATVTPLAQPGCFGLLLSTSLGSNRIIDGVNDL